jgi:hypothetical protein
MAGEDQVVPSKPWERYPEVKSCSLLLSKTTLA